MKRFLSKYLDCWLLTPGCMCVVIGLAQWNAVIAWVAGGVMLMGFGLMVGKAKAKDVD